jgi:predicted TIM-barrel fold metal-dependent hydrolase
MRWIDTHVHLFSKNDSDNSGIPLVSEVNLLNTPDVYFEILGTKKPEGVVVVHFSKAKDSEHVINSLDELKQMNANAVGVIKADLNDARTFNWMQRPDVKGIRLYAKESMPDVSGEKWADAFKKVKKNNQHILVFGEGAYLTGLIKQIPDDITILVDHLGLPKISGEDADFNELLSIAKKRGNVYFKGPGYRTSLDVEIVKPLVRKIVESVGIERLMLGASDAPFAGLSDVMNYEKILKFVANLAYGVANDHLDKDKILYGNAKELYGF